MVEVWCNPPRIMIRALYLDLVCKHSKFQDLSFKQETNSTALKSIRVIVHKKLLNAELRCRFHHHKFRFSDLFLLGKQSVYFLNKSKIYPIDYFSYKITQVQLQTQIILLSDLFLLGNTLSVYPP